MIIETLKNDKAYRLTFTTVMSMIINGAYAVGNFVLGIRNHSYWFVTLGAYFFILSLMRFGCINALRTKSAKTQYIGRFTGILFIFLCLVMSGSMILSNRFDVTEPVHEIVMLIIATYTTAKTVLAVVNIVEVRKTGNPIWISLRNISCADAAVSILSMQRSMLVSFGSMDIGRIKLMNILTGLAVCLLILYLGMRMIVRSNRTK